MKPTNLRHSEDGHEILDPRPMQPPLGYRRQPSLSDQIRQQVLAAKLADLDALEETEEEADDFNVEDEMLPSSQHENEDAPTIQELKKHAERINNAIKRQNTERIRAELEKRNEEMVSKNRGREAPPSSSTSPSSSPEDTEK